MATTDVDTRAQRLATLEAAAKAKLLPIDSEVAAQWARLRAHLADTGRRVNVNDLWIAATAAAHDLPIMTHDADFEPLEGVRGIQIIRISPTLQTRLDP